MVSIHAPARGATHNVEGVFLPSVFQSTRPQGARPGSIHPLALYRYTLVSIHAPARGATTFRAACSRAPPCFNPRARKGRDCRQRRDRALPQVSIHAPARGATSQVARAQQVFRVSIHAPARGATAFDLVKNEKAQGKNIIALRPQSIYLEK